MELKHNFHKTAKLVLGITAMLFAGFISLAAAAATVTYPQSFSTGWNLAGNSLATPIDVKTSFGTQAGITTIWKWDAAGSKWAFYAPSLDTAGTLASYAAAKGYNVLSTINQGEGYWVNASAPVSLAQASGTGFSLAASNLVTGWNLVATGDDVAPATFTTTVGNVTTQWAWDNVNSAWYFYAPSLVANNTLASYISSKSYKEFGTLTLGNGRGFWVNYAGTTGGGTQPSAPTAITATAASATQVNLSWTAVTGATAYRVYRSTASGTALNLSNLTNATVSTTASVTNHLPSTTYYYKVTAMMGTVESPASAEVSATTSAGAGSTPTGFVARANPTGATTQAPGQMVWTGTQFIALEQSTDYHNSAATFFSWASSDGVSWTRNTTNMPSTYVSLTAANGLAFQMSPSSTIGSTSLTIYRSADGITWTPSTATYTIGGYSGSPAGVKYLNGTYFASLDVNTCNAITSTDAATWTSINLNTLTLPTGYTRQVNQNYCSQPFFMGGKYLIYGGVIDDFNNAATPAQGLVYSSTDGVAWTANSFALPTGANAIPQGGRDRTVLQLGNTIVLPLVQTETSMRINPTDPYPTLVVSNKQVATSTDGLNFIYTPATDPAALGTLQYYPDLQLPGGLLASTVVYVGATPTYTYYLTSDGVTYTATSDLWVGQATARAYSPTLKRLIGIKQQTNPTTYQLTGATIGTYDFP